MFGYVTSTLLTGFATTCLIFVLTLVIALPLGLVISFGSMSKWAPFQKHAIFKPIKWIVKLIVWIIRGTPLMLQVLIVFYGPGLLFDWGSLERLTAVIVAFVINYACYFSEIFRGGIEGVPKGQTEAGQVLGMTKGQIFFKVTLMQVIKRIVPPMSNEIITLVKDTSLARIIAVQEIIMAAQKFVSGKALIWPLFYSGVFYLVFCGVLTLLFGYIERKLSYFKV